jgi:hypothetical protein
MLRYPLAKLADKTVLSEKNTARSEALSKGLACGIKGFDRLSPNGGDAEIPFALAEIPFALAEIPFALSLSKGFV